jgi:hypothetical protein
LGAYGTLNEPSPLPAKPWLAKNLLKPDPGRNAPTAAADETKLEFESDMGTPLTATQEGWLEEIDSIIVKILISTNISQELSVATFVCNFYQMQYTYMLSNRIE